MHDFTTAHLKSVLRDNYRHLWLISQWKQFIVPDLMRSLGSMYASYRLVLLASCTVLYGVESRITAQYLPCVDLVFVACHGSMLWLMQLIDLVLVNKDTSVYTVVFACICCNALCIPPVSTGRYLTLLSVDVISSSTSSKKIMKSHKNVCSSGGCSIE